MENLRGIAFMLVAMVFFAIADMFIKMTGGRLPTSEVIFLMGVVGTIVFAIWTGLRREPLFSMDVFDRAVLLRNFGEILGTLGFVTALILIPISSASAIIQATPLAVTLGAALFMGESVGWRRWSAIFVGLVGVLMIIQPGTDAFRLESLFAVQGMIGLTIRDLAMRATPARISTVRLSAYGFAALVVAGLVFSFFNGPMIVPSSLDLWLMTGASLFAIVGVYGITAAMRLGDVAVVAPFRYSRIVFALIIGYYAFGESPNMIMLIGVVIVVASGLYTFAREHRQNAAT